MALTIRMNGLDRHSVRNAINQLKEFQTDYDTKMQEVCERLAHLGEATASVEFAQAEYDGTNDVSVVAEPFGNGWRVRASGNAVLFIEFGSGATKGYGHPEPQGYGPGTYPGKGHWNDPKGWVYGGIGSGKNRVPLRSFGNRPAAAMYHAEQDIRAEIERVVSEVFGQ